MIAQIIFLLLSVLATGDRTYYLYEVRNAEPVTIYGCDIVQSGSWFGSPTVAVVMPDSRDGEAGGGWFVPDPYRYFYVATDAYHPAPVMIQTGGGLLWADGPGCHQTYFARVNHAN